MRLHILSDLHLEFWDFAVSAVDADVTILAGDIHTGRHGRQWARAQAFADKPVVYVCGNHEFYGHSLPGLTAQLIRDSHGSHVQVVENAAIDVVGFTILACTLWTDFKLLPQAELAEREADRIMSDYNLITWNSDDQLLKPSDTIRLHQQSLRWLQTELARRDPARCAIVTHHAPSAHSIPDVYRENLLSAAFASALDSFVEQSQVPLWIHGHTHHNVDYTIGRTRILTNQRGYPDQRCAGFQPDLVVEI